MLVIILALLIGFIVFATDKLNEISARTYQTCYAVNVITRSSNACR